MRAAIYARFSCSKQREASIEDQLRVCREWCAREGHEVVAEYCDYAMSGRTDERPEFQRMVVDAATGAFDLVSVYMMDRFSRSEYDAPIYKRDLRKHGVEVVSATESLPDGPERVLIEKIYEGLAAVESVKTSMRTRRGMEGNALKCRANGVRLYGYTVDDEGRFAIDPGPADVVREAFAMRCQGQPVRAVAEMMRGRGATTALHTPYSNAAVERLLKNEAYMGVYHFGSVRKPGGMPAIVDAETFDRAQRVKVRRRMRDCECATFALTGRMVCGSCGRGMGGTSGNGNGGRYNYYRCQNCRLTVRQSIEGEIVEAVREMLRDGELVREIAQAVCDAVNGGRADAERDAAEKGLQAAEAGLRNLLNAIERGAWMDSMQTRIAELERQKAVCAATLERLRADALEVSEVVGVLEDAGGMPDADLLEAFVGQVWVGREAVRVTLNFDRGGEPARLVIPGDGRVRVSDGWCPSRVFGRTVSGWTLALVDGRVQMERALAA